MSGKGNKANSEQQRNGPKRRKKGCHHPFMGIGEASNKNGMLNENRSPTKKKEISEGEYRLTGLLMNSCFVIHSSPRKFTTVVAIRNNGAKNASVSIEHHPEKKKRRKKGKPNLK